MQRQNFEVMKKPFGYFSHPALLIDLEETILKISFLREQESLEVLIEFLLDLQKFRK